MKLAVVYIIIAVGILCTLIWKIMKTRSGKGKMTREKYAAQCTGLLFTLAADGIAAISTSSSLIDFLFAIIGVEAQSSDIVEITARVLIAMLILCCCGAFLYTYIHWTGPVSKRQHRIELDESNETTNVLKDVLVVLQSFRKTNLELGIYKPQLVEEAWEERAIIGELSWREEFARMYRIITNQSGIDIEKDWHSEQKCYISKYAKKDNIGILCTDKVPEKSVIEEFLKYILHFNQEYFHIIVAVKEGDEQDYTEMLDGSRIEYMFKDNMLERLVDFTEYDRTIDKLYHAALTERSHLRIEDVYVEPYIKIEDGENKFVLKDYVNEWLKETSKRQLALLGDFGQGKTLFTIYLTYHLLQQKKQGENVRIPILIPLRGKSPRNSSQEEILSYFGVQYGICAEALAILNANGKLLIVFDGFDEMDLVGSADIRKRHFKSLWSLVRAEKSKILVTGRPNYFMDRNEMDAALNIYSDTKELAYCQRIYLQPFDEQQIKAALRKSSKLTQNGIEKIFKDEISSSFLDLISRPSNLFFVSLIWDARKIGQKYANLTSAMLIDEFLQWSFERQASKKGEENYCYLSPLEREYFMIGLAVRMRKLESTVISYETFQESVEELIAIFPEELSGKNTYYLNFRNGKSIQNFANQDENSARAIINDVRSCGVLVNDYVNEGLTFAHKSFYDLLVAKYFLGKYYRKKDEYMIIASILSEVAQYNLKIPRDLVIRKLLAELITMNINVKKIINRQHVKKYLFNVAIQLSMHQCILDLKVY